MSARLLYTLKSGAKTIGFYSGDNKPYIIGFNHPTLARKIHYSISHEPQFKFSKDPLFRDFVYSRGSLEVTKQRSPAANVHDATGLHMVTQPYDEFLKLPFSTGVGLVIPYEIQDEDAVSIVLLSHVVDPFFHSETYKRGLQLLNE